jgi:hypothetical protein
MGLDEEIPAEVTPAISTGETAYLRLTLSNCRRGVHFPCARAGISLLHRKFFHDHAITSQEIRFVLYLNELLWVACLWQVKQIGTSKKWSCACATVTLVPQSVN